MLYIVPVIGPGTVLCILRRRNFVTGVHDARARIHTSTLGQYDDAGGDCGTFATRMVHFKAVPHVCCGHVVRNCLTVILNVVLLLSTHS